MNESLQSPDSKHLSHQERPTVSLRNLSKYMKRNCDKEVNELLDKIIGEEYILKCVKDYQEGEDDTETLLHIAVKYEDNIEIIRRIVDICPELLMKNRDSSANYKGQTALHVAITRRNNDVIKMLLSKAYDHEREKKLQNGTKSQMLNMNATGRIFANTVMMGDLPLSVAALTFNAEAVSFLHKEGAFIHARNSSGDTVLHSLVKYSAIYPNKTKDVIKMCKTLNIMLHEEKSSTPSDREADLDINLKGYSYLWYVENNDHFTPLQLAAKHGVVDLFQFIINLEHVYSFISTHDGLFDVKLYDITEIDTITNQHLAIMNTKNARKNVQKNIEGVSHKNIETNTDCSAFKCTVLEYPEAESILEMMFDYEYRSSSAFRIIETIPVKNIIQEKWGKLKTVYFVWGFFHLLLTVCLTIELVIRSNIYAMETLESNSTSKTDLFYVSTPSKDFAEIFSWMSLIPAVIYSILVILLLTTKFRRPNAIRYTFHNLGYICFLFVFSVCLFVDFFNTRNQSSHDNISLILAIIAGWWFAVFFLRAIQLFSFFTEMIRRVIIGDLLRFSVIISFMLFAFTAGMYAVFVGKLNKEQQQPSSNYFFTIEENFDSYGSTLLTMFKLMLGLGDIEVLNQARIPGLAIGLYVVFAILTYVLLMNSLIAMMSQTCAIVLEDKYPQWRLQQVSVILFLEDLLCLPCIKYTFGLPGKQKEIRRFDPVTKQTKIYLRSFLTIHSLQTTYASEEDTEALKNTMDELRQAFVKPTEGSEEDRETFGKTGVVPDKTPRNEKQSPRRKNTKANGGPDKEKETVKTTVVEPESRQRNKTPSASETLSVMLSLSKLYQQLSSVYDETIRRERGETHYSSIPLTPVNSNLHVHNHRDICFERRQLYGPNAHLNVDIEPYS